MLKLRVALCLALIVGILTLVNGTLQGARFETIVYRFIISIAIFGFVGYGLGFIAEGFLKQIMAKNLERKQEEDSLKDDNPIEDNSDASEFAPFTASSFQQVKRPEE